MSKTFKTPKRLQLNLFKKPYPQIGELNKKGLYGEVNKQILKLLNKQLLEISKKERADD